MIILFKYDYSDADSSKIEWSLGSYKTKNRRRAENEKKISKLRSKFNTHLRQNIQRRYQTLAKLREIQRSIDGIPHSTQNTDKNTIIKKPDLEDAAKPKNRIRNLHKKNRNYKEWIDFVGNVVTTNKTKRGFQKGKKHEKVHRNERDEEGTNRIYRRKDLIEDIPKLHRFGKFLQIYLT